METPYIVSILDKENSESSQQHRRAGAHEIVVRPFAERDLRDFFDRARKFLAAPTVFNAAPVAPSAPAVPPRTSNRVSVSGVQTGVQILGRSPATQYLREYIRRIAPTQTTVLIQGESGTGKELVARALHQQSPRSAGPFVKLNCAALPESLVESELFGHERGAFTGAIIRREGRFGMANGGTLLLDEVSEVSLAVQSKLLRVIQEREYERVGGNETLSVDVRIVATTNRNLEESVERGEFREDLFFRLNVVPVYMPPLRDRLSDVPILAEYFLEEFCRKHSKPILGFAKEAMDWLKQHSWPGNIRELQNMIERGVVASGDGPVDLGSLSAFRSQFSEKPPVRRLSPPARMSGSEVKSVSTLGELPLAPPQRLGPTSGGFSQANVTGERSGLESSGSSLFRSLAEVETDHIQRVLDHCKQDLMAASRILRIAVPALQKRLPQREGL
jgi:transcriptional regulator with GAF, ATPase, and Fis domain